METPVYTLAMWHVRPGKEDAFVTAWSRLAECFSALPRRPLWGTLVRSEADPTLFFSFGPWHTGEDVAEMRADPQAQHALADVRSYCIEATPGLYHVVQHVQVLPAGDPPLV